MTRTLIAACGGTLVNRLRKTFPVVPIETDSPVLRRRGRILGRGELALAALPSVAEADNPDSDAVSGDDLPDGGDMADIVAELAFYLGGLPACTAVLLVVPAPQLVLADRVTAPGRRELVPDLLEPASRLDGAVRVTEIAAPPAWTVANWALRRLGPHQFWVAGVPSATESAVHRGLRSIVAALEEQNR
jgi:hypothetical protein